MTLVATEELFAWNGVSTRIDTPMTPTEALVAGELDFTVDLAPVQYLDKTFSDRFVVYRDTDKTPYGVVGSDYKPLQNRDAFGFMDSLFDTGEANIVAVGNLFDGGRTFLVAKIGEGFTVAGDDAHESYLIVTNAHDGKASFGASVVTYRLMCTNQLNSAIRGAKQRWSITHRSSLEGKLYEAKETLQLAYKYEDAFQAEVDKLLDVEVTKDTFMAIMEDVLPSQKRQLPKNLEELSAIWDSEPTTPSEDTGWKALNVATFWNDHKDYRSDDARFKTLTEGAAARMRGQVKDRVLALA